MQYRTETTLEELLAEPIVLALMERDGISLEEARRLYDKVSSRTKRGRSRAKGAAGRSGFGLRVRPSQAHAVAWM
jgi:hypothetical protein